MQRLEVSCAVRRIYMSLGAKGLIYTADVIFKRHFCISLRRPRIKCKVQIIHKSRIAMAKVAFNKKKSLFTSKLT